MSLVMSKNLCDLFCDAFLENEKKPRLVYAIFFIFLVREIQTS